MRFIAALVLFLGIPELQSAMAEVPSKANIPKAPDNVIFERDIPYREGHDRWVLNVIRPREPSTQSRAVVVLVHGGGWSSGDHYRFSKMGFTFAQKGYVRKEVPPIMLVHGAKDTVVFIDSTDEFSNTMKATGADITYLRFEDAGHAVMGQKGAKTTPAMHTFFEKHLRGQRKGPS